MTIPFDDKGKIFTDVVSKEPIEVIVQTTSQRIEGSLHIRPGERLKDELNHQDRFVAVTDAVVMDANGQDLYRTELLLVNREAIVWVLPKEEMA